MTRTSPRWGYLNLAHRTPGVRSKYFYVEKMDSEHWQFQNNLVKWDGMQSGPRRLERVHFAAGARASLVLVLDYNSLKI